MKKTINLKQVTMGSRQYNVQEIRAITAEIKNFHILEVTIHHVEDTKVKIRSARFKQSIKFDFNHNFSTVENAVDWLLKNSFDPIGIAEGKDCYYIITTTFKPLKK